MPLASYTYTSVPLPPPEYFCAPADLRTFSLANQSIQALSIRGTPFFRDWDLVGALGAVREEEVRWLFAHISERDSICVLHPGTEFTDDIEVGGFVHRAGAFRMAAACRHRERRTLVVSWLRGEIGNHIEKEFLRGRHVPNRKAPPAPRDPSQHHTSRAVLPIS